MAHDPARDVAAMLAALHDESERRMAERNPQGAVNLLRRLLETVVASDDVSATETATADAKMDWRADAEWGFSEW